MVCGSFHFHVIHINFPSLILPLDLGIPGATHAFTALDLRLVWMYELAPPPPPPPEDPLRVSVWCFSASSRLFWRTNKSIPQEWLLPKFRKRMRQKKVGGGYTIWVLSRSLKFCVSGPHQTCNVCGKRRHSMAGCYSDHTLITSWVY